MKRVISLLLISACACMYCLPAFGWGQEGHRIIAKIAYDNLNRKAKKNVDAILGKQGIIYYANWADELKSDNIYPQSIKDGWHFQDFPAGLSDSIVADALIHYPTEGGNLYRVLDSLELDMEAEQISRTNMIHTLRFIVHLSGDRYCPMHMAHMDDKGGNAVKMKWFGRDTNLHTVWDTKLIESQGYSYTEYAEMLQHEYKDIKRQIEQASDEQLLVDSYHVTEAIYKYQEIWDGNTYHYIYTWRQPMERQLYIAGIRLAKLLNSIF
ncbi:MAG: S1/P1 nuclease [Paludibacteraceae bacterium]|nr:S1/P1 nuclease [Paludibacteraceae bacterium]